MNNRPSVACCSFCGDDLSEVELLFRSEIGGLPPFICAGCVEGFHDVILLNRQEPALAAQAVAEHNAAVERARG